MVLANWKGFMLRSELQAWSLKQALDFVSAQRPQISPNSGFMARLIRLEESLHGTKTVQASPQSSLAT